VFTTELVDTGGERLGDAFARCERLHAPGPCGHWLAEERPVGDLAPVRAHDAIEAEVMSQYAADEVGVEAAPDFLVADTDRDAIRRHHLSSTGGHGGAERFEVAGEAVGRVHLPFAVCEVGIFAVFDRAVAGEVSDHRRDALGAHAIALQSASVRSPRRATRAASSPNVPQTRAHRGSVATSS